MKKILGTQDVSKQIYKWAIKLTKFDVTYVHWMIIKAQMLVDSITKFTTLEQPPMEKSEQWHLYMDGASLESYARNDIVLKSLTRTILKHLVHLTFSTKKNQAEYEAIIAYL